MHIPRASVLLLGLSACLSVHVQAATDNRIPVLNESQVGEWWGIPAGTQLAAPAYPARYAADRAPACVAVGYLLNADGTTSDLGLLKSWSAAEPRRGREAYWREFANEAASAMAQWRFVPTPGSGGPRQVYTVATFLFAPTDAVELAKRCAIPNLPEHIIALSRINHVRLRMSGRDIFDRLEISPSLELAQAARASEARMRRTEFFNQQMLQAAQQQSQSSPPPSGGGNDGGGGGGKPGGD